MKLTIVNYGVGNLRSLQNALAHLDIDSRFASRPEEVMAADKLILPGVGAFAYAMANIRERKLDVALSEKFAAGTPILGICLGMQLLLTVSEENGEHQGLDFVPGRVRKLNGPLKVPHMGWNEIAIRRSCPLTQDLPSSRFGYFVHSYTCAPDEPDTTVATTDYGSEFPSIICRENVFGAQFHPEKSQELGLQILKNFAEL